MQHTDDAAHPLSYVATHKRKMTDLPVQKSVLGVCQYLLLDELLLWDNIINPHPTHTYIHIHTHIYKNTHTHTHTRTHTHSDWREPKTGFQFLLRQQLHPQSRFLSTVDRVCECD